MKALHSALYVGKVAHHRLRPRRHRLRYDVFYLLIDLDEVEALAKSSWLFSAGRFGFVSFYASDHGDRSDVPLRLQLEKHLRAAGLAADGGAIRLLTLPRILGYAFNPLSVYFCHRRSGQLMAVFYEVTNTFGDRHLYLIPVESGQGETIRQQSRKQLHVSPFLDNDMHYTFGLAPLGRQLALSVTGHDTTDPVLVATLEATRRELTDGVLARTFLSYPLLTFKVIAAIYWEALRLWCKGLPIRQRPSPPRCPVTIGHPIASTTASSNEAHPDVAA